MDTDKHGYTEVIIGLHIKLPGKTYRDLLEVKVDGGKESCMLLVRA